MAAAIATATSSTLSAATPKHSLPVNHHRSVPPKPSRLFCLSKTKQKRTASLFSRLILDFPARRNYSLVTSPYCYAALSTQVQGQEEGVFDPELRLVFELATDEELFELERILFGPSFFSPFIKSVAKKTVDVDYTMIHEDLEERGCFIAALESRFLFLAADARSTLRGWRPSYRNVLLAVRKNLGVPCSSKLSSEDLEAEIFLHLVEEFASEKSGSFLGLWEVSKASEDSGSLERGLCKQKLQALATGKLQGSDFQSIILKGGSIFTLSKIYQWLETKIAGKIFLEAASYQFRKQALKKGGQLAAVNLESRAALMLAKKGLAGAASRYLGLRSIMSLMGPMMWGTFIADVVIQMLGTDYARILRAIYAFAQIRITRTYRSPSDDL